MNRRMVVNVVLGCLFAASLAGVAIGMNYLRSSALRAYGSAQGQAEWDRWRTDVAKEVKAFSDAEKGEESDDKAALPPVKRRVSKSPEPPALLLMRDRFGVCLAAALLLSGAMLGSILLLVRGAILGSPAAAQTSVDPANNS